MISCIHVESKTYLQQSMPVSEINTSHFTFLVYCLERVIQKNCTNLVWPKYVMHIFLPGLSLVLEISFCVSCFLSFSFYFDPIYSVQSNKDRSLSSYTNFRVSPNLLTYSVVECSSRRNQSSHLDIHKQTKNACWSIPRSQTVFIHLKTCRRSAEIGNMKPLLWSNVASFN